MTFSAIISIPLLKTPFPLNETFKQILYCKCLSAPLRIRIYTDCVRQEEELLASIVFVFKPDWFGNV